MNIKHQAEDNLTTIVVEATSVKKASQTSEAPSKGTRSNRIFESEDENDKLPNYVHKKLAIKKLK